MVAGAVTPPRLELANEDLIRAHVQAVWLATTGLSLGSSLKDILDFNGDNPSLELQQSVIDAIQNIKAREQALEHSRSVLSNLEDELKSADWYSEGWLEEVLNKIMLSFNKACERWRSLYRAALKQREIQRAGIRDH